MCVCVSLFLSLHFFTFLVPIKVYLPFFQHLSTTLVVVFTKSAGQYSSHCLCLSLYICKCKPIFISLHHCLSTFPRSLSVYALVFLSMRPSVWRLYLSIEIVKNEKLQNACRIIYIYVYVCVCVARVSVYHHTVQPAQISLTLTHHSSLSSIALGRSSMLHRKEFLCVYIYIYASIS